MQQRPKKIRSGIFWLAAVLKLFRHGVTSRETLPSAMFSTVLRPCQLQYEEQQETI